MKVSKNTLTRLFLCGAMVCALALQVGSSRAQQGGAAAGDNKITAIDILLEPDATMLQHSADNNARLLKVFPKGFALDATHRPHITLIQRFVRTADLDKVYAAAHRVLAADDVNAMILEAFKYYYAPSRRDWRRGHLREADPGIAQTASGPHRCRRPVYGGDRPHRSVHRSARRCRERRGPNPVCVDVRAEDERRKFQSARQHRRRPDGIPRPDACRTV